LTLYSTGDKYGTGCHILTPGSARHCCSICGTAIYRTLARQSANGHEISVLLANRENALNALQELDFDFKLGKIPAEEYSVQRASLLQMGVEALRRLDEIQGEQLCQMKSLLNRWR
jgi:hypothetical protein